MQVAGDRRMSAVESTTDPKHPENIARLSAWLSVLDRSMPRMDAPGFPPALTGIAFHKRFATTPKLYGTLPGDWPTIRAEWL
jgi:hypothetical protein